MNLRSKRVASESMYFNNDPMAKRLFIDFKLKNSNYTKIN